MNLSSSLNVIAETPLEKEQLRKIKTVLQMLYDNPDSIQFQQPVDWEGLGLFDYKQIIKNPMDLGTVSDKLKGEAYHFIEEILDDIQLIWDNCKCYNQAGSWIYNIADKMDKFYKKLIKNYFSRIVISQSKNPVSIPQVAHTPMITRPSRNTSKKSQKNENKLYYQDQQMSGNDKHKLVQKLTKLNIQNLGKIVQLIIQNCPKACHYIQEDSCQISIQKIDNYLVEQIKQRLGQVLQTQDKLSKKLKI